MKVLIVVSGEKYGPTYWSYMRAFKQWSDAVEYKKELLDELDEDDDWVKIYEIDAY